MFRTFSIAAVVLAAATAAQAHFPFIVPQAGSNTAQFFLSEELTPATELKAGGPVAGAKLSLRTADGRDTPLTLTPGDKAFGLALPAADGVRVVHGILDLGVAAHGTKPYHLIYHPKTIVGPAFIGRAELGNVATPIEITPAGDEKSFWLVVTFDGKPAPAGTEVHLIKPDNTQEVYDTDAGGRTERFSAPGRYGAWAKSVTPTPGELDGKKYDEIRHYATLVFDSTAKADAPATRPAKRVVKVSDNVRRVTPLPEAVSSFGATTSGDFLYVYGGHTAVTHSYDTSAVSKQMHRLNVKDGSTKWETLPPGPGVQGLNLAAYDGKIYRVGGMEPRNAPGTEADNFSIDDASVFDPKTGTWSALPPLPERRSSHDVTVVGHTLYVVGGWVMDGKAGGVDWPEAMFALDLTSVSPAWKSIPQPFKRRALMSAAVGNKLYVVGGFTETDEPTLGVDVFDTVTGKWSTAPALPGGPMNGFSPAALGIDGTLYVSTGDGVLRRLDGDKWATVAQATPRIVHRLARIGNEIWVLGGATSGKNLDLAEAINVTGR